MCPGGFVVPAASGPEQIVVNGMSPSNRGSRWSNSGMVVELRPEDLEQFTIDNLQFTIWLRCGRGHQLFIINYSLSIYHFLFPSPQYLPFPSGGTWETLYLESYGLQHAAYYSFGAVGGQHAIGAHGGMDIPEDFFPPTFPVAFRVQRHRSRQHRTEIY